MTYRPILFNDEMVRAILDGTKTQTRRIVNVDQLRVIPRRTIRSDLPREGGRDEYGRVIASQKTKAMMNRNGAVSGKTSTGQWLGLKPGEFDFVCPNVTGNTELVDGKWHIRPETHSRLWVRETTCIAPKDWGPRDDSCISDYEHNLRHVSYKADGHNERAMREYGLKWTPSIHVPRWASRITLEITDVRVERLQDISEGDAMCEGVDQSSCPCHDQGNCAAAVDWIAGFKALWDSIYGKTEYNWDSNAWVWAYTFRRVD